MQGRILAAGLFFFAPSFSQPVDKNLSGAVNYDIARNVTPAPGALLRENLVKFALPPVIGDDTLSKAFFYVSYSQKITNKMAKPRVEEFLGADTLPPFEILWDASHVPDQDYTNLEFRFVIADPRGREKGRGNPSYAFRATLDRQGPPAIGSVHAGFSRSAPVTDGSLEEWAASDSTVFTNGDNLVSFRQAWDEENLYFAIRVVDSRVTADSAPFSPHLVDGVEIFLDVKHDRGAFRSLDDFQLMIPAGGRPVPWIFGPPYPAAGEKTRDRETQEAAKVAARWHPRVAQRGGSGGYQIEAALSWRELGISPGAHQKIGFNLVNSDRDHLQGVVVTHSWAGISDLEHHNPNRWGTLELLPAPSSRVLLWGLFCAAPVLLVLVFVRRKVRLAKELAPLSPQTRHHLVEKAIRYLESQYHDEELNLQRVAEEVQLSPEYLRKLFKNETKVFFADYLRKFRVEKSKVLLSTTEMNIYQVAYEAGFGNTQNFNQVFKKSTGLTPTEYRNQGAGAH